jgi:hypothetical protein
VRQIVCVCGENNVQHVDSISSPTCSTTCCTTNRTVCGPLKTGITSIHNEHVWQDENAHEIRTHSAMRDLNQAVGWNLGDCPILLARTKNSDYLNFLRTHVNGLL